MNKVWQDLRYGLRMLYKNRGFTAVALLALALGIGANSAIFSVVNSVLLRPLPYRDAQRLIMIWENYQQRGGPEREWASPADFRDFRDQAQSFEHIAALLGWGPTLTGQDEPEDLQGAAVSHDSFAMLGVEPALGRSFTQDDDQPGAERVVVLSHQLWQRRFSADASIVTAGFSLAMIRRITQPRSQPELAASNGLIVLQTSVVFKIGKLRPRGITPITV